MHYSTNHAITATNISYDQTIENDPHQIESIVPIISMYYITDLENDPPQIESIVPIISMYYITDYEITATYKSHEQMIKHKFSNNDSISSKLASKDTISQI